MATSTAAAAGEAAGRIARKKSAKGAARSSLPVNHWRSKAPDVQVGQEQFGLTAYRGDLGPLDLGQFAESVDMDDSSAALSATVQLRLPRERLPLEEGNRVRCTIATAPGERFRPLWTLRAGGVNSGLADGGREVDLSSDLQLLQRNKGTFHYKRDKAHPKGWLASEIAIDVARLYKLPLGSIAKGTFRIRKLVLRDATPWDVIVEAYKKERQGTGQRFVMRFDNGRLSITPLRRSRYLLMLAPLLIDATYTSALKETFATALTVKANVKVAGSRKRKKLTVEVRSAARIARYGYVHDSWSTSDADNEAEALHLGRRRLAKLALPSKTLELTHEYIPGLRRGDAMKVRWVEQGLDQIVFVTATRATVSAGQAQATTTVRFTDPYEDALKAQAKDKRELVAKARKRKAADAKKKRAQPKKAAARKSKAAA